VGFEPTMRFPTHDFQSRPGGPSLLSPATRDDHEGDTVGEHEFVTMLSPWWSLLAS
jgi:hypothetical protein